MIDIWRRSCILVAGIAVTLILSGSCVWAESTVTHDSSQPISISSDRLEADDLAGRVKFFGHVVAEQGGLSLYADQVELFYQGEKRDIERLEAHGDVRIVQGDRVATAGKAVFYNKEKRIVLTESPAVHQGNDSISGDEITFYLDEEKSVVNSREGSRINAVFHPQKAEQ